MNEHQLFKKYSLREMIMELKKIKITTLDDYQIVSEISKKQKLLLEIFNLKINS